MRRLISTVVVLLTAISLSGCGGEYTPVNQTPETNPTPAEVEPAQPEEPEEAAPTESRYSGPSMNKEFADEAEKAKDAWRKFTRDKTKENYVVAMVHMFNTMRYKNIHVKNGRSSSSLRGFNEFKSVFWADKSKVAPIPGADEDPRYIEAKKAFDDSQSAS